MASVITSINNAITLAQRLREISKHIEDSEFKNVLADLSMEIADTKMELAKVTEENANLQSELTKLKHSQGDSVSRLVFKEFAYFTTSGDGPFCSGCYDSSKRQIRLAEMPRSFRTFGTHECPSCKQTFGA